MQSSGTLELDVIEELRMRRWARENYVPRDARITTWHPVVLDEMLKKDQENPGRRPEVIYSTAL